MEGTYIIQVEGMIWNNGKERRLLSCDETGIVNLWIVADRSGKQRWQLLLQVSTGSYLIKVAGGTNAGETYLSGNADGSAVNLWFENDGSGRQEWVLTPV